MNHCFFYSPIGWLRISDNGQAITALHFVENGAINKQLTPLQINVLQQLEAYFTGHLTRFDVPLAPMGTPFQQSVWCALQQIPYGATCAYGQIAAAIGNPKAARAVGMANNRNPIAIIIPCHRVIGKNHPLTGYAGGLHKKEFLLTLEKNNNENGKNRI